MIDNIEDKRRVENGREREIESERISTVTERSASKDEIELFPMDF